MKLSSPTVLATPTFLLNCHTLGKCGMECCLSFPSKLLLKYSRAHMCGIYFLAFRLLQYFMKSAVRSEAFGVEQIRILLLLFIELQDVFFTIFYMFFCVLI